MLALAGKIALICAGGIILDDQVNVTQRADLVEHLLCRADVHENQVAQTALGEGVSRFNQSQ